MEKEFVELLKKKAAEQSKSPVDSKVLDAKKNVVKEIMDMLKGGMSDQMKGLKKVTVASDSPEGLEKGLNKAQEIIGSASEDAPEEEEMSDKHPSMMHNMEESLEPSEEEMSEDESSEDEIAELEKKLAELKAKKKM